MSEETETTNKVLETKIDGLAKLTDERFSNIKETLIRIESISHNYVLKTELEEAKKDFNLTVKRMEDWQIKHGLEDKESFGNLALGQQETKDTLLKWGSVMGSILFVLSFLAPAILKYWFHI